MGPIFELITTTSLLWLVFGSLFGLVVGAIPGLTAMMGMALILPLTFTQDVTSSIAMLLGCYVGGIAGGLVSSTLLGIPGSSSSIATTFDAYPMAKSGQPVRALGIGITASLLGGLLGFIALITLSPFIAGIAIKLGPTEYFSITILALVVVGALAGNDLRKGLAAAFIGLLAGAVGFAPIDSTERFTFGIPHLWGGIEILPLIIGLFAIVEMLRVLASDGKADIKPSVQTKGTGLGIRIREIKDNAWNVIRSSVLGIVIGVLPGMGGTAANLVSYSRAKQTSAKPEAFGKGAAEGIWAPESSNSAATGGALVPTMTLGIPGDGVTAILLGGLVIHGIQPGPLLFDENPAIVNTIFVFFMLAVVMVFFMQTAGTRIFPLVLEVPKRFLFPILMVVMTLGSYSGSHSMGDVWLIAILGLVGYGLAARGIPMSPLLLGYILGPITEVYFRRALIFSDGDVSVFVTEVWSAIFLISAVVFLIFTLIGRQRQKSKPLNKKQPTKRSYSSVK